jgi:cysteinyl-tRNA synthetase
VDLIFPHHENELAQGRAVTGEPQAHFWLHSELVLAGGKKMIDAEGSRVALPELLERGYSVREVRFFLLQTHYRQPIHLVDERLEAARTSLQRLDEFMGNLANVTASGPEAVEVEGWVGEMKEEFHLALFNDMNISAALAALFGLVRKVNYLMSQGRLRRSEADHVLAALQSVDEVLAILPPEGEPAELSDEVQELVRRRDEARRARNFELADQLRDELASRGYVTVDLPGGTRVKRKDQG